MRLWIEHSTTNIEIPRGALPDFGNGSAWYLGEAADAAEAAQTTVEETVEAAEAAVPVEVVEGDSVVPLHRIVNRVSVRA